MKEVSMGFHRELTSTGHEDKSWLPNEDGWCYEINNPESNGAAETQLRASKEELDNNSFTQSFKMLIITFC